MKKGERRTGSGSGDSFAPPRQKVENNPMHSSRG